MHVFLSHRSPAPWPATSRCQSKRHLDGIQHLMPFVRIVIQKLHHVFLAAPRPTPHGVGGTVTTIGKDVDGTLALTEGLAGLAAHVEE